MDKKGELTGDDIAYIFPDMKMAMKARELKNYTKYIYVYIRHDICHMHHMQRMCKTISPGVKFYILKVLFEQFM